MQTAMLQQQTAMLPLRAALLPLRAALLPLQASLLKPLQLRPSILAVILQPEQLRALLPGVW